MKKMKSTMTLALAITSTVAFANEGTLTNNSVSGVKQNWNKNVALVKLKENELNNNAPALYIGKTREQVKALKQQQQLKTGQNKSASIAKNMASAQGFGHSFAIYDGYASLIEDLDGDNYYQTFSVTFDADVINYHYDEHARVYAELYLSKDGGDWIHYYTTDNFSIYGEREDDEFEVYTTLNQGYVPAHYDVLIDLYEVGYSDIVASYSANDTSDLYALPLESSNYDPDYQDVYVSESHSHGGSIFGLLSLLAFVPLIRNQMNN